jgi:hypothetical protein
LVPAASQPFLYNLQSGVPTYGPALPNRWTPTKPESFRILSTWRSSSTILSASSKMPSDFHNRWIVNYNFYPGLSTPHILCHVNSVTREQSRSQQT